MADEDLGIFGNIGPDVIFIPVGMGKDTCYAKRNDYTACEVVKEGRGWVKKITACIGMEPEDRIMIVEVYQFESTVV